MVRCQQFGCLTWSAGAAIALADPMLKAHAASDHGFSLVEVLVAVGLMTTAVATLARLFVLSVETNLTSRHRTYAAVLAQQKLEELRAEAFESSSCYTAVGGVEYLDLTGQVVGRGHGLVGTRCLHAAVDYRSPSGRPDQRRCHPGGGRAKES